MARGALTTAALPSGALTYHYTILDVPGTVAANNFMSLFNPTGNTKNFLLLYIHLSNYAVGASSTPNSIAKYRVSTATGGTLIANTNISRYDTNSALSTAQVRINNPTVTKTTGTPGMHLAPPMTVGAGGNADNVIHAPSGTLYIIHPGEGIVFGTSAGNANQIWSVHLIWCEY